MRIGFTGTRHGMNDCQLLTLKRVIGGVDSVESVHHGDCVGADCQFHQTCRERSFSVVLHPPIQQQNRAWCSGASAIRPSLGYLQRDHQIVDESDILIATPDGIEKLRSGTWATVRYARKCNLPILIIRPDGNVSLENGGSLPSEVLPRTWEFDGSLHHQCGVFWKTAERFGSLSNMASGFPLLINGTLIQSSEALYQAMRYPFHPEIQQEIIEQPSPMSAKMKAKKDSRRESFTRSDWDQVRVEIMRWCLRVKLYQHFVPMLLALKETGNARIVEYSKKDSFWGSLMKTDWILRGENRLGRLLEELRVEALAWLDSDADDEEIPSLAPLTIPDFLFLGQPIQEVVPVPFEDCSLPTTGWGQPWQLPLSRSVQPV
jgi:ribA/ribD-fused uncharacterized protein